MADTRVDTRAAQTPPREYIFLRDEPAPVGFSNPGVLCWLNALLQTLLGATAFKYAIEDTECDLANNALSGTLMRIIRNTTAESTRQLIAAMGSRHKLNAGQQCAMEGFDTIVDMLGHKDIIGRVANQYAIEIECPDCKSAGTRYDAIDAQGNPTGRKMPPGIIPSMRDRGYRILIDSVAEMNSATFTTYIRTHHSSLSDYTCPRGHHGQYMNRQEKLKMLYEVAVVVFDKFHRKENRWYPAEFSLPAIGGSTLTWKLIGTIEHSGNMSGGHYVANTLRGSQWYHCNDGTVTPREYPEPTANTFMMIYHIVQ